MTDTKVNISYSSFFGQKGTLTGQFDYPTGICALNGSLYIVDKQNNRVQKFTEAGVFVDEFTGFFFPEKIATDGTYIYITEATGGGQIIKLDTSGNVIDTFTGFAYPKGIAYSDGQLFVANWQNNSVDIIDTSGIFINSITGLFFPESVVVEGSEIVVANTGLSQILRYNTSLELIETTAQRAVSVQIIEGLLTIVNDQTNSIDFGGIEPQIDELFFPYDCTYANGKLYVVTADHRVVLFDFSVETGIPVFAEKLRKLAASLYPKARAWWMKKDSTFDKLNHALGYSESRALSSVRGILDSIIPDNDNFSEADAQNWERALGMYEKPYLDLEMRKTVILRKMQYPNKVRARQHYKFIEGELQANGFDVYLYENRFPNPEVEGGWEVLDPRNSVYDIPYYGGTTYDNSGIAGGFSILANHIDPILDSGFAIGNKMNLRATFFVGGPTFGSRATISDARLFEFRALLLKLKPVQVVAAFLIVDYVDENDAWKWESNEYIGLESDGSNLILESA